jgi:uncharacterized protein YicC (UPF0701 family)
MQCVYACNTIHYTTAVPDVRAQTQSADAVWPLLLLSLHHRVTTPQQAQEHVDQYKAVAAAREKQLQDLTAAHEKERAALLQRAEEAETRAETEKESARKHTEEVYIPTVLS